MTGGLFSYEQKPALWSKEAVWRLADVAVAGITSMTWMTCMRVVLGRVGGK